MSKIFPFKGVSLVLLIMTGPEGRSNCLEDCRQESLEWRQECPGPDQACKEEMRKRCGSDIPCDPSLNCYKDQAICFQNVFDTEQDCKK